MTLFRTTLLAAAVGGASLIAARSAQAQPVDGLYVGAGAGYDLLQDLMTTVETPGGSAGGTTTSAPMKVKWGGGYAVSGSVGWGLGNGVRLELEGTYRNVAQVGGGGGRQSQAGFMGNALYDVDVGLDWATPYVGFGIGYQAVSWRNVSGTAGGSSVNVNQTLGAFAYQAIVGVAFPIEAVPGLAVTAEYRYMNLAGSRDFHAGASRVRVGEDGSHSFLVGLRFAFGAPEESAPISRPPPAPAPRPAPAAVAMPARTYLVFFDWDSATLTPRARDIIAEAVRNSVNVPHTRIEVTGHADRSGTARGNQVLSLRRAQVVAAELVRSGVPTASIDIHAAGDTKPLVPTAAGIRQPENRRVEIVYR